MERTTLQTPDGLTLRVAHHPATDAPRGTVLLAHGITQDMDEGGMFVRLADCLAAAGFNVVRFTYRGHGDSDGRPAGVTIAGELLDFQSAFEHTTDSFGGPYFVVAKSFGGVSTCLSLARFEDDIAGVVLWNPVLDIDATFLDPSLPWGERNFTGERLTDLRESGTLDIDGGFEMGRVLYEELGRYDPGARLAESPIPSLVIHGDADSIVPYEATRQAAIEAGADFHTIDDADHGFVRDDEGPPFTADEREQDTRTVAWLTDRLDV